MERATPMIARLPSLRRFARRYLACRQVFRFLIAAQAAETSVSLSQFLAAAALRAPMVGRSAPPPAVPFFPTSVTASLRSPSSVIPGIVTVSREVGREGLAKPR